MATENLKHKLGLYSDYWDKPPYCEILGDHSSYFKGEITGTEQNPNIIEFECEHELEKKHSLVIHRTGKTNRQTVVEDNKIIKDQLLKIKFIEIDEIDLGSMVFYGLYEPEYPEPWATQQRDSGVKLEKSFQNVTAMGHNGKWTFNYTCPFYSWVLENLY